MSRFLPLTVLIAAAAIVTGCHSMQHASAGMHGIDRAVAVLHPTASNKANGVIHFTRQGDAVRVQAQFAGLTPNGKHGFHIHEFGDCTADNGTSAGGHYNPEGHDHALPESAMRHAGDLGNLEADAKGNASLDITVSNITIAGTHNPILGRGVIVHANADDGGQPVGNAGARIACGVIGVARGE